MHYREILLARSAVDTLFIQRFILHIWCSTINICAVVSVGVTGYSLASAWLFYHTVSSSSNADGATPLANLILKFAYGFSTLSKSRHWDTLLTMPHMSHIIQLSCLSKAGSEAVCILRSYSHGSRHGESRLLIWMPGFKLKPSAFTFSYPTVPTARNNYSTSTHYALLTIWSNTHVRL